MIRTGNKNSGTAFQRGSGAEEVMECLPNTSPSTYAIFGDLQTRHVRVRCGVSASLAQTLAGHAFGRDIK